MGRLSLLRNLALIRIHVIQTVIGADRAGVRGCPSGVRPRVRCRSAGRTLYLPAERDTGGDAPTPAKAAAQSATATFVLYIRSSSPLVDGPDGGPKLQQFQGRRQHRHLNRGNIPAAEIGDFQGCSIPARRNETAQPSGIGLVTRVCCVRRAGFAPPLQTSAS